jgi:hypothetical protein
MGFLFDGLSDGSYTVALMILFSSLIGFIIILLVNPSQRTARKCAKIPGSYGLPLLGEILVIILLLTSF